jgi:3-methyladenine DNA glycosylase AlkD
MKSIIIDLHSELLGLSDEEWKKSSQRYFKESVEFIGVKGKEVQRLDKYVTNWATCDTLCNHTDYSCPQRALPGRNFRNCFYSPSRPRRHGTEGIRVDA